MCACAVDVPSVQTGWRFQMKLTDFVEGELAYWSDQLGECTNSKNNNNNVHFSLKYLSFASIHYVVSKASVMKLLCSSTW